MSDGPDRLRRDAMSDSVGQYLNEIGTVPLLNAQEERELAQIIEKGFEARERLAAGEKGREIRKAIRQAIGRALDQKASLVRLPGDRSASLRAALRQASGDGDELDEEHARLHRLTTPTSLDRTIGDDDSNELVDLIPDWHAGPEQEVMDRAETQMVTDLLDILDARARYAVEQRFGLHDGRKRSYREVGEELGVTAEAARRLVKRAVNTVRDHASATIDAA
jgi:RNA polymerase primary sigma factor